MMKANALDVVAALAGFSHMLRVDVGFGCACISTPAHGMI